MTKLTFQDVEGMVKSKQLGFHNFYNLDIPITTQYSIKYYKEHQHDTIDSNQFLNTIYLDIELYTYNKGLDMNNMQDGELPINIVTIRSSEDYILWSYILLFDCNLEQFGITSDPNFKYNEFIKNIELKLVEDLKKLGYTGTQFISDQYTVNLNVYSDEKKLLFDMWQKIHEYDPDILTSWNGDHFDYPYNYYRLSKLYSPADACQIMSKFNDVKVEKNGISIFEYTIADLLKLYRPRSENNGLNYGRTLANYTLDNVAFQDLGLKKIEYKDKNITLDDFFLQDPYTALLYNIVDVLLICGLDAKNQHIDLNNTIRRIMKCPFHNSMVGSSALFEHFVFYKLSMENKVIRTNINTENSRSFKKEDYAKFPVPHNKKGKLLKVPAKIEAKGSNSSYSGIINKFPGAFVNTPIPRIINDGSLIVDCDATALYPSMILQSNISFDSYKARVIPPYCYSTMQLLENCLGKQQYPNQLVNNIESFAIDYVYREDETSKDQLITNIYYITLLLFDMLSRENLEIQHIYEPKTTKASIILKTMLIPLLDIMNTIHPHNTLKNNPFAYKKIMYSYDEVAKEYPYIYILHNPNESNAYIKKYSISEGYVEINKYIMTLAGTLFAKHNEQIGLFADFLLRMKNMRNEYKSKLKIYEKNSQDYNFNNNRQKSVKVVMNTTYGLYGLSTFRYSNHWLARSITNNGIFTNKMAQSITERLLTGLYG